METKPPNPPGKPPPGPRCPGNPATGVACTYRLKAGESHCYNHDPKRAGERAAAGRKGGRRVQGDIGSELGSYNGIARRAAKVLQDLEAEYRRLDPASKELGSRRTRVATARLNALRLLTALVSIRTVTPVSAKDAEREGYTAAEAAEDLVG